jgi:hypothetical protein
MQIHKTTASRMRSSAELSAHIVLLTAFITTCRRRQRFAVRSKRRGVTSSPSAWQGLAGRSNEDVGASPGAIDEEPKKSKTTFCAIDK